MILKVSFLHDIERIRRLKEQVSYIKMMVITFYGEIAKKTKRIRKYAFPYFLPSNQFYRALTVWSHLVTSDRVGDEDLLVCFICKQDP